MRSHTPTAHVDLSAPEARQIAVAASMGTSEAPDSASILRNLGLLQLDPLTRVEKAHRLTCLSRMHPTATATQIDDSLWSPGAATSFEMWVHAVCLVPIEDWPLLRLARERALNSAKPPPKKIRNEIRAIITAAPDGATITDIEQPEREARGWDWSLRKHATEHMLRTGEIVCTTRRGRKRVFDLPERRIAADVLNSHLTREEILSSLASKALTALGIATASDISTYYNLPLAAVHEGLEGLGAVAIRVEGWEPVGWGRASMLEAQPRGRVRDEVLVGPFDNLIWDRARTRRIFEFDYLFEAYKPAAKRRYGCYVLALLDDDKLIGRADVQRTSDRLQLLAAYAEPSTDTRRFDRSLERALARLRTQLNANR